MEPPVPAPCRPRARARVFRAGQGPLTSHACGHSLWPWSSSPAPEGRLERMPCSRVHDSLRIVFQRRGLALGSSGKLQCVRTFASTIGALCELPKDLGGFPAAQTVKNVPAAQETCTRPSCREGPLEEGVTTPSSILAGESSWPEEPGGL